MDAGGQRHFPRPNVQLAQRAPLARGLARYAARFLARQFSADAQPGCARQLCVGTLKMKTTIETSDNIAK